MKILENELIDLFLYRFALGGAASRVLKAEFNPIHMNKIMGYIFDSLRSLDWIEVRIVFRGHLE